MRQVVIRAGTDAAATGASLETVRLALGDGARVDVVSTPASDAMVRAFARGWSALRVHDSSGAASWHEMVNVAHEAGSPAVLFADGSVTMAPDDILRLLDRATQFGEVGMVAPLLVSKDGRIAEAGRVAQPDGQLVVLGTGDDPEDADYTCDRHTDACSPAVVAMPRPSVDLLARAAVSESEAAETLWSANRPVVVTPSASALTTTAAADATQRTPDPMLRRLADRRHRAGVQVLIGTSEISCADRSGVAACAAKLAAAGSHVTVIAIRSLDRDVPYRWCDSIAGRAGATLALLERDEADDPPRNVRLRELLTRRRYDVALLWSPTSGRWFLPRLNNHSPATRVVARMPAGWSDRASRQLLEQVRRRWLSPEAFDRVIAPV